MASRSLPLRDRLSSLSLLIVTACLLAASLCTTGLADDAAETGDPALARYNGGLVRLSDLSRESRFLSKDEAMFREVAGHDSRRRHHDWAIRMALRRIVENEVAEGRLNLSDDERERARKAARSWSLARWRETCYGEASPSIDANRIRQEMTGREIRIPKRARLSHIFLKLTAERNDAQARQQLSQWKNDRPDFAAFQALARQHSDSETAVRGGSLGLLRPEHLPSAAEPLFDLPAGSISEPLRLPGGWHLFYVEEVQAPRTLPIERQVKREMARRREAQRDACREQVLARIDQDEATHPDGVIRVGDWTMDVAIIQQQYAGQNRAGEADLLGWYRDRESLYQQLLKSGDQSAEEAARAQDLRADQLLEILIRHRIMAQAQEPAVEVLMKLYSELDSKPRSQREMTLKVLHCDLPDGQSPLEFDTAIRQLAKSFRAGETDWDKAAAELSGTANVELWPSRTVIWLAGRFGPKVFDQVQRLTKGEISDPIRDVRQYWIVEVIQDEPARVLEFGQARDQLLRRWFQQRNREIRKQTIEDLLLSGEYQYLAPDPEPSAE